MSYTQQRGIKSVSIKLQQIFVFFCLFLGLPFCHEGFGISAEVLVVGFKVEVDEEVDV